MGSFYWDQHGTGNDLAYTQYYNGRPLSVALTEPCCIDCPDHASNDFTAVRQAPRSRSLGRRFKRESYSK